MDRNQLLPDDQSCHPLSRIINEYLVRSLIKILILDCNSYQQSLYLTIVMLWFRTPNGERCQIVIKDLKTKFKLHKSYFSFCQENDQDIKSNLSLLKVMGTHDLSKMVQQQIRWNYINGLSISHNISSSKFLQSHKHSSFTILILTNK